MLDKYGVFFRSSWRAVFSLTTIMKLYFTSTQFKRFLPDWAVVVVLLVVFFEVTEVARPFSRQFSLADTTIGHPFAVAERVTDNELYVLSALLPTAVIVVVAAARATTMLDRLHLIQVSSLGLWFSVTITSVLTDVLKCWIGNPRPDFLARCGPRKGTPVGPLVGVDVCTAPLGEMYLLDGMKSTPLGHSSMAFAGLGYLTLWLVGQWLLAKRTRLWELLVLGSPLILASYIALSRTQDYRHHFFDIVLGGSIGIVFAVVCYRKYFHNHLPVDYE